MKVFKRITFYKLKTAFGITALSVCSWLGGSLYEKYNGKNSENYNIVENIKNNARNSIFGIVFAATMIDNKDDNKLVKVQSRTSQIMKHGFPSLDEIRSYDDFVLSYDRKNKIANWVFEHLTVDRLKIKDNVNRALCEFTEDTSIHPYFRSTNEDYFRSGYDRGHLAAAGNHRLDQRHCDQTFLLSNISPQVGVGFNRNSWNRLEKYVRKLTKKYPNVYVCTGPLFLPREEGKNKKYIKYEVIGKNDVAVPTHFFKVIVMEDTAYKLHVEAYVMPNEPIDDKVPLTSFQVPPNSIERHAGLLFFDRLSLNNLATVNGVKK